MSIKFNSSKIAKDLMILQRNTTSFGTLLSCRGCILKHNRIIVTIATRGHRITRFLQKFAEIYPFEKFVVLSKEDTSADVKIRNGDGTLAGVGVTLKKEIRKRRVFNLGNSRPASGRN